MAAMRVTMAAGEMGFAPLRAREVKPRGTSTHMRMMR
jgi:hypothetical protein